MRKLLTGVAMLAFSLGCGGIEEAVEQQQPQVSSVQQAARPQKSPAEVTRCCRDLNPQGGESLSTCIRNGLQGGLPCGI